MPSSQAKCPKCSSEYAYADGNFWVCPECAHAWSLHSPTNEEAEAKPQETVIRDAHGNVLSEGDTVTVIKDLKIKGAASSIKAGTKVKKIRLIEEPEDGHNIACKIDGVGALNLKSEFVKKI